LPSACITGSQFATPKRNQKKLDAPSPWVPARRSARAGTSLCVAPSISGRPVRKTSRCARELSAALVELGHTADSRPEKALS
jgi:hypothetical protein